MNKAQIIVLAVALGAGGLAAMVATNRDGGEISLPPAQIVQEDINTVEILVAANDVGLGTALSPADIRWQNWPEEAASVHFIRRSTKPNAIEELDGAITRSAFVAGEPMREAKLIKSDGQGFLSAILPSGSRAVSVEISPETASGGFILPNDFVDIILTQRDQEAQRATGLDTWTSETVLRNIRVLAIDQTVEEQNGERVVVGRTATVQLTPEQAEVLMLARSVGTLSLALRSIADADEETTEVSDNDSLQLVKFGISRKINNR